MNYYQIADITLGSDIYETGGFDPFLLEPGIKPSKCDLIHRVHTAEHGGIDGELVLPSSYVDVYKHNGVFRTYCKNRDKITAYNILSDDYGAVDTYCLGSQTDYSLYSLFYEFASCVLVNQGLMFHSAAVEHKGEAVLFSGPSGIGKSTHSRRWKKLFGALILDGDTPVIRMIDDIPMVYGIPWCGTSGETIDRAAPLKAVVFLKQGQQNSIRRLTLSDAVSLFYKQIVFSFWNANLRLEALYAIPRLFNHTDIYVLECTNSDDAACIAEKHIFNK